MRETFPSRIIPKLTLKVWLKWLTPSQLFLLRLLFSSSLLQSQLLSLFPLCPVQLAPSIAALLLSLPLFQPFFPFLLGAEQRVQQRLSELVILRKNKPSQIKVNGIKNKIKFLQCRTNVDLYHGGSAVAKSVFLFQLLLHLCSSLYCSHHICTIGTPTKCLTT